MAKKMFIKFSVQKDIRSLGLTFVGDNRFSAPDSNHSLDHVLINNSHVLRDTSRRWKPDKYEDENFIQK